jgi:hypothetical protein
MTPNADLEALIRESIEDAFRWYSEDIDKDGLMVYVTRNLLADLKQAGYTVSRNDSGAT